MRSVGHDDAGAPIFSSRDRALQINRSARTQVVHFLITVFLITVYKEIRTNIARRLQSVTLFSLAPPKRKQRRRKT
jgi:hypothetical protein